MNGVNDLKCIRFGMFGKYEKHICFYCFSRFSPGDVETCENCNWKKCGNGHCGCSVSKETMKVLDKFYDLFCEPKNYSKETKDALKVMLETYNQRCKRFL